SRPCDISILLPPLRHSRDGAVQRSERENDRSRLEESPHRFAQDDGTGPESPSAVNVPDEQELLRVENLGEEFKLLSSAEVASRIAELVAAGESRTVLTLLIRWLALPSPAAPLHIGHKVGGRYTLEEKIG